MGKAIKIKNNSIKAIIHPNQKSFNYIKYTVLGIGLVDTSLVVITSIFDYFFKPVLYEDSVGF